MSRRRVFSIARRFSIPISQAIPSRSARLIKVNGSLSLPKGRAGEGASVSLRIGIRAFGNGLTYPSIFVVSTSLSTYIKICFLSQSATPSMSKVRKDLLVLADLPSFAPNATIPTQLPDHQSKPPNPCLFRQPTISPNLASVAHSPEFLSPNELQLLPKLNRRALGSIVLMSFSINPRTLFRQPFGEFESCSIPTTIYLDVLFFHC